MYKKLMCCSIMSALLFMDFSLAEGQKLDQAAKKETAQNQSVSEKGLLDYIDGFLNVKFAHERKNDYAFGPKNATAIALNPIIGARKFTFDGDFYFGRQYSFVAPMYGVRNMAKTVPAETLKDFYSSFRGISKYYLKAMDKNINEKHFYRNYTRLTYKDEANDFRVVIGDTTTRNQIGSQQAFGGMGISIFRQGGDGSVINSSTPIVLTRPSKIEVKMGDDILAVRVLPPGTYYLDDLPEEAKIPGVALKVSDQLNRSVMLTVDYFGGYGMVPAGKDDFDVTLAFESSYDIDDPCRVTYANDPRLNINYRRGINDDLTVGAGLQTYKSSYLADITAIFNTKCGKISPHFSYNYEASNSNDSSSNGIAGGLYYAIPANDYGVMFETFFGAKSKDFGDLKRSEETAAAHNAFMNKYFPNENLKERFKNTVSSSSSRQAIARLYSKPIFGITPSFTFNGVWSKSERWREYSIALVTKIWKATLTATAGITYDDPHGGINQKSPDRRLTVALTVPVGDVTLQGTYTHHDDQRLRGYAKVQYNPSQIEGLEIIAENYFKPGYQNPQASVKYEGKYLDFKLEESITNTYANSSEGKVSHGNQQRFFFGTAISPSKIRDYQKSNVNILKSVKEYKFCKENNNDKK